MTSGELHRLLAIALDAARQGAAELEAWRSRFTVREKSPADLVTDADTASQHAIRNHLRQACPEFGFLGEEGVGSAAIGSLRLPPDAPPTWVCDPLDGTANYAHDVPAYCVNLALVVASAPVVAVTLDPRMNECFTAVRGGGAFLNGQPIRVSAIDALSRAMLATGFPAGYDAQKRNLAAWDRMARAAQALRRTGSTALNLAYVAAGRFDGYWCYDNWPWDVCAGVLLVTEAGGRITDAAGGAFDLFRMDILASNGTVHDEALAWLAE